MGKAGARLLTKGEVALVREAFGEEIALGHVRIRIGAGGNPIAGLAFRQPRTSAITLVGTIHFRDREIADFSNAEPAAKALFMHEMTHIWQYQRLGVSRFLLRYLSDLDRCDFRPAAMYGFAPGETAFAAAMLEAQAAMVQHYHFAVETKRESEASLYRTNLAGSGIYGC